MTRHTAGWRCATAELQDEVLYLTTVLFNTPCTHVIIRQENATFGKGMEMSMTYPLKKFNVISSQPTDKDGRGLCN
uniref:DNA-directed RNA polymerase n=1 Tax=Ascaris lumbricoides TaxID=6252 RepID=A0A0M3I9C0_ASCLU